MAGEEDASDFQKLLQRRLNTMTKTQSPAKPPPGSRPKAPSGGRPPVTRPTPDAGSSSPANPFLEELQRKRNAVVKKGETGITGVQTSSGERGEAGVPTINGERSRGKIKSPAPGGRGGVALPPTAPKRADPQKKSPKPGIGNSSEGVIVNGSNTHSKTAEIAQKLGLAADRAKAGNREPAGTGNNSNGATANGSAGSNTHSKTAEIAQKWGLAAEKAKAGNHREGQSPGIVSVKPKPKPGGGVAKPVSTLMVPVDVGKEEPIYVNVQSLRGGTIDGSATASREPG